MLKHSLLRLVVIVAPATIAVGFIVHVINDALAAHGIKINPYVYTIVLCLAVYETAYWTAKPLIDDARKRKKNHSHQ